MSLDTAGWSRGAGGQRVKARSRRRRRAVFLQELRGRRLHRGSLASARVSCCLCAPLSAVTVSVATHMKTPPPTHTHRSVLIREQICSALSPVPVNLSHCDLLSHKHVAQGSCVEPFLRPETCSVPHSPSDPSFHRPEPLKLTFLGMFFLVPCV